MAVYAIGDVQGCYDALQRLLEKIDYSPDRDQLWFAGDLVNRGKKSLKTLRFVKSLGDSAITILGNHDITLLAMHYGVLKPNSYLKKILRKPDRVELIDWLRSRPLMHIDEELGFCMVHAGISPSWDLQTAQDCAREVESVLSGDDLSNWLGKIYGNKPRRWSDSLESYARHRYIVNAFTRMRFCDRTDGALNFKLKGPPVKGIAKAGKRTRKNKKVPWFECPVRQPIPLRILFGHWSSLGYYQDEQVISLDTGCVWGRKLTAVRLDAPEQAPLSQPCWFI